MTDTTISLTAPEGPSDLPTAVVAAVAAATNTDELELPPLYDVVDPDALERLCDHQQESAAAPTCEITFSFAGCEVEVDADRCVTVRPEAPRAAASAETESSV